VPGEQQHFPCESSGTGGPFNVPVHDSSLCTSDHQTVEFKILREENKTYRVLILAFRTADFDLIVDLLGKIPWRCTEDHMRAGRAVLSSPTMREGNRLFRGTVVSPSLQVFRTRYYK